MSSIILLFIIGFFSNQIMSLAIILLLILVIALLIDYALLFFPAVKIITNRNLPERFSNGDNNEVNIDIQNNYSFPVSLTVIDEIPYQFQKRDQQFFVTIAAGAHQAIHYFLRPATRGEYIFGQVNIFAASPLSLIKRHYQIAANETVAVYPSFLQMRHFELMALPRHHYQIAGIKKTRRIGHSLEFEQIKDYVTGDDYRTINWKATARKGQLMVNNYTDEKSQPVFCVIDKSRVMKMAFNGMTLLDYAINASLVLSNIMLKKQDKAGLITYAESVHQILLADNKPVQMEKILEALYAQRTHFLESDLGKVYVEVRNKLRQRSFLILFTNFESLSALDRQLIYLKNIARHHLLLVVFFENTELHQITEQAAENIREVYQKIVAEKFNYEKRMIVRELHRHGIMSILTPPEKLTMHVINKYLELKAHQAV